MNTPTLQFPSLLEPKTILLYILLAATCTVSAHAQAILDPSLRISTNPDQTLKLSWPDSTDTIFLEETESLLPNDWRLTPGTPVLQANQLSITLPNVPARRFYRLHQFDTGGLPLDPSYLAHPLPKGVATQLAASTDFLYQGQNPVQTGVVPGTIHPVRVAVIRGKVLKRDDTPLSGVTITILDHPEFGQTLSRSDGEFDLAVNGGGLLVVDYQKTGYCPVQRQVQVPWQDYVVMDNVVMIQMDPVVTTVDFDNSPEMQVHQGSLQSDSDGDRQATLLFAPGTTASLVLPDGSTQPVTSLNIRATEFTVGSNGPAAMPGVLPPTSGYTYCVELSADEAAAQGATIAFDKAVYNYVENFIGFPVGTVVPSGYYDREKAAWIASENGLVIKILGIAGGLADVDTDGDDVADTGEGITDGERQQLATLYTVDQSLWRVPVTHFTPWDYNWPYGPPDDATRPNGRVEGEETSDDPSICEGCIIEMENQVLGEIIGLAGTPYSLNYRSNRVPGREASRTLNIQLTGASVPASLESIRLKISVAGQKFTQTFPATPNLQTSFVWDGLDAYGRSAQGKQLATGSISYIYPAEYKGPGAFTAAFGRFGIGTVSGNRQTNTITLSQSISAVLGESIPDARTIGLGAWTISGHHFYDPVAKVLDTGDGRRRSAGSISNSISTVAGKGFSNSGPTGDGGPAWAAIVNANCLAVGPDGSIYIGGYGFIRRVGPDGIITTVAGSGAFTFGFAGDGGPALQAELRLVTGIAIGPDGGLYFADQANHRIRRVTPDGIIDTVAGSTVIDHVGAPGGFSGDGGPATLAELNLPSGVAVGPDGSLYVSDFENNRIRKVDPDGIITTVAGTGILFFGTSGDGGPATQARINFPEAVAIGPDGSLYIGETYENVIRRVGPNGIITTVAGTGTGGFSDESGEILGDGWSLIGEVGPATQARLLNPSGVTPGTDGSLYIADRENHRIRRVAPDGMISTVAGSSIIFPGVTGGFSGDGGPATQAELNHPQGVALGPDGSLYIADTFNYRIRRVAAPLAEFSGEGVVIVSEDGTLLYQFDRSGRHLRTLNALTGAVLFEFGYDSTGLLDQVTEKTGGTDNVTTIEHDAAGNPTAIVAPFGQRTELRVDENGFLASITNPAGEEVVFDSTPDGLLTSYSDPRGNTRVYTYDASGRLIRDDDPAGGSQVFSRTTSPNGSTVTRTTALNRVSSSRTERLPVRIQRRTITATDDTQNEIEEAIDAGTTHTTSADGTTSETKLGPDPRFGMQSPITASFALQFPSTLQFTASSTRTVDLTNPSDPMSLVSLTDTTTVDGRTSTHAYSAASRTWTSTTPEGRTQSSTVDELGRLVQSRFGNLDPVRITFDTRSRLQRITKGSDSNSRSVSLTYNTQGWLDSITDSLGRTAHLSYDSVGRVTRKTLPDGRVVTLDYDAAGNLGSVTAPGRPAYTFGYSDRDELTLINPPAVPGSGSTVFVYNADGDITEINRAGVQKISMSYDTTGRPVTRMLTTGDGPATTDTFSYDSAGRTSSMLAASGINFSYDHDGSLPIGLSWSGPVIGSVTQTIDSSLRLASQSVNGANPIAFSYDNDGLLTGAGDLAIVRDSSNGLPTATTLGTVTASRMFNGLGEMTDYTVSASGNTLYESSYVRNGIGRITEKMEAIDGVSDTYAYEYDTAGQLTRVVKNGTTTETYAYDSNGNRTNATFDHQDRLLQSGTTTFSYNGAGDLVGKTTGGQATGFDYDPLGNLLEVILADGTAISYLVDGLNRRVGRKVNGALVQGFLYNDLLRPVAELDGAGALVSRFVYAGGSVPSYLIRDEVSYRLVTDQIGSVRLVVNASSGAIAQRMDYDSFGNVLLDTNPGFQPFGFAGGIYDPSTGLVRFGARDYDSETGRWTAQDPIGIAGNDPNLYRYCLNDPVNLLDPAGLDNWDAAVGFLEQMNEEIAMTNPFMAILVLVDSGVNGAARSLGFDPGPSLRESLWHSGPTSADRNSEDYATGELAAVCLGVLGQLATGFIGEAALAARLAEEAETLARQSRIAERLASRNGVSGDLQAAAAEARNAGRRYEPTIIDEVIEWIGGWRTGGGGSGIGIGGGH